MRSSYIVKDILREITSLLSPTIERASREAQLLLMAQKNVDELWLITNQNTKLENVEELFEWALRRAKNEPFEYIVNKVSFYSEEFFIGEGALIPRPETEILIDEVIKNIPDPHVALTFVEVGIGSGIISIMLAKKFPHAKIIAIDISEDALSVARINIRKFDLENRIELRLGSLLQPITEHVDYLVSNPPYIENGVDLESNLAYEPQNALFGGSVGDEIIKELLDEVLSRDIKFFSCEMGYDQKDKITEYLKDYKYKKLDFYKDLSYFDRGFTLRL
ncbi:peptide chain release factor N(5)-glutamine methyltransferase [Sulfurimonas sp. SAG-AH-194-I05]|nr:peptide chain release factor N(5)-glutamine methyltransferase [Sulfurimonas sp. SAG-AH-194-I05]MDF1874671.1 peptide chain release factor N(5)-glutamine methyltransferase [Sulfurimonas sp. SAG-AH-194-I05]